MFDRMSDLSSFRISWIGTGVMGRSMCGHLLANGARVSVFTEHGPRPSRCSIRRGLGGTPRESAEQADIVFTIVGFPADVRDVYFSMPAPWLVRGRGPCWST